MKKLIVFLGISILLASCEGTCNKMDRDGALIGKTAGNWIVVKYNGGILTDVWKLKNVLVQSEENSDGWLFRDQNDNMINIGGDSKAIRVRQSDEDALYNSYVEYRMEFDSIPYHQKLLQAKQGK